MAIDKSDFKDWLDNPVTKEILLYMRSQNDDYSKKISGEIEFLAPTYNHFQTVMATAYLKGACGVYKHIIDLDFDEFETLNPTKAKDGEDKEVSDEISTS